MLTDVEIILGLIQARAEHYGACATTMFDVDEDVHELQARFAAQERALAAVVAEIKASVTPLNLVASIDSESNEDTGWALITEMGGQMTATIFRTLVSAMRASDEFCADAIVEDGLAPHASCQIHEIEIPPRSSSDFNEIDGRWALITEVQKDLRVTLCEDAASLRSMHRTMEQRFSHELRANDAAISYHLVVVPSLSEQKIKHANLH